MSDDSYRLPKDVSEHVFHAAVQRLTTGDWYFHIGPHILADLIVLYFVVVVAKKPPPAHNAN